MLREKYNTWEEKKDYEGERKGTIAKKKKRLRVEIKGVVNTKGENKLHEGGKKM